MKGIDHVIKKTAMDLNIPEDKVKLVVTEYWKEIKRDIANLNSTTIGLVNIGYITISRFKLRIFIKKTIRRIRREKHVLKGTNPVAIQIYNGFVKKLNKLLIHRNKIAVTFKEKTDMIKQRAINKYGSYTKNKRVS